MLAQMVSHQWIKWIHSKCNSILKYTRFRSSRHRKEGLFRISGQSKAPNFGAKLRFIPYNFSVLWSFLFSGQFMPGPNYDGRSGTVCTYIVLHSCPLFEHARKSSICKKQLHIEVTFMATLEIDITDPSIFSVYLCQRKSINVCTVAQK